MYLRGHNILEKLLGPDRYLGYRVYNYCGGAVAAGRYAAPGTVERSARYARVPGTVERSVNAYSSAAWIITSEC